MNWSEHVSRFAALKMRVMRQSESLKRDLGLGVGICWNGSEINGLRRVRTEFV